MADEATSSGVRDTSRDGLRNKVETWILTGLEPLWAFVNARPGLAEVFNKVIVDMAVSKAPARPLALSTMHAYPSWASLTDRTWFSRYLPPKTIPGLPTPEQVAQDLFTVGAEGPRISPKSTMLFASFAQWFTDGFLMTNENRRRTRTNHQIDLDQLYGIDADVADALRLKSGQPGEKGRLKSETTASGEWAPRLFDREGVKRPEFAALPDPIHLPANLPPEKKALLFAFGGERANSTAYTAAINTVFFREHNRLCGALEAANPGWDDDRVFDTARNINIVLLIKIVVEEYINHISPYWFRLLADPTPSYTAKWNRENWIPVEFNLLYRWHSLIPETITWGTETVPVPDLMFNHVRLERDGLGAALDSASRSKTWQIGLFNTSEMLRPVEAASIGQGRINNLASYNDYREIMKYPRVTRFEQISGDKRVTEGLRRVYGDVDRIEFFAGLFAEDVPERSAVPPLLGRMVAVDAFSHALTNPLLSPHVFNEATFSPQGMATIEATSTLRDLVLRNLGQPANDLLISMDQENHRSCA